MKRRHGYTIDGRGRYRRQGFTVHPLTAHQCARGNYRCACARLSLPPLDMTCAHVCSGLALHNNKYIYIICAMLCQLIMWDSLTVATGVLYLFQISLAQSDPLKLELASVVGSYLNYTTRKLFKLAIELHYILEIILEPK